MVDIKRFSCVAQTTGLWMVWDGTLRTIAKLGGPPLEGRSGERAEVACGVLERIYRHQLDAPSVRLSGLLELSREQDDPSPRKR